jgi:hypothetical protein
MISYNPNEADKSYIQLLEKNGLYAAVRSLIFIGLWLYVNTYILNVQVSAITYGIGFLFFAGYYTWQPKLIRFLRSYLRSSKPRNKTE